MTTEAKGIFDMDLQFLMQMYKKIILGIYMPITEYKIFTLVLSSFSNTLNYSENCYDLL